MLIFTRSILDRLFAVFLSLVFGSFTGWFLYEICADETAVKHANTTIHDWILDLLGNLMIDTIAVVFVFSVLGLIWAVFTPRWLTRLLVFCGSHLKRSILIVVLILAGMLLFSLLV